MNPNRIWQRNVPLLIRPATSIEDGMRRVFEFCERSLPHPLWAALRQLPFQRPLPSLRRWLSQVLRRQPPRDEINALWFGIFDLESRFYVAGSTRFKKGARDGEWAVDPEYWPRGRYAPTNSLSHISRLLYNFDPDDGLSERAGQALEDCALARGILISWAYVAFTVSEICTCLKPALLLGGRSERHVTVGFDEGGYICLGTVTAKGWQQRAHPRPSNK